DNMNQGYSLRFDTDGKFEWSLGIDASWGNVSDSIVFPQGEWVTITAVLDDTNAKIYVNGELRQDATLAAALAPSLQNLIIGDGAMWKNRGFSGNISDVRIWSIALTSAEVMANYDINLDGTESGLVANWKMDEGEGVVLADNVGNYEATIQEGVVWLIDTPTLDTNEALIFDGTELSYVDCGSSAAFSTPVLSNEARIKLPQGNSNANKTFIATEGWADDTNQGCSLRFDADGKLEWSIGIGAAWENVLDSLAFPQGEWTNVSAVLDHTSAKLYVNGELRQDVTLASSLSPTTQNLIIGDGAMWRGRGFSGSATDVRIWSIARTSSEVMAAYTNDLVGTEIGLVANWQMDEGDGMTLADKTGNYEATLQDGVKWDNLTTGIDKQQNFSNGFKVISSLGTVALINNEITNTSASIYTISGKKVCAVSVDSGSSVTVSDMLSGIYIVRFLTSGNVSYSEKFVVQ
ncbi:MAG: T9SS type A sorting domain-containing protein, partial [Bacteroidales bacterium]|nr:T9SS type A sorting domain-containing protein [Bacteroidales bacterium]